MDIVFEWDARKAGTNFEKHRVRFEEAKTIFNDPLLVTYPDEVHSDAEARFISIGMSASDRLLLAVHTDRYLSADLLVVRLVSCRRATPLERRTYEEGED